MSRGQQGIGISAAGMYAQLTTGKPVKIISRTGARAPAHYFEIQIDTKKNEPRILENKKIDWEHPRGTQVTLEIEGRYQKGRASVDEYLEQTAIANPHVKLVYHTPEGETREYPRTIDELPPEPREIKPHPYGIELGVLLKMLHDTKSHSLAGFLAGDFSRVSAAVAAGDLQDGEALAERAAAQHPRRGRRGALQGDPGDQDHGAADELHLAHRREGDPPRPVQADQGRVLHGGDAAARGVPRQPVRDRGRPGLRQGAGPGGGDAGRARGPARRGRGAARTTDELARVIRFANRVPLLYQQSACATSRPCSRPPGATTASPSRAARCPPGPMVIFVHMASVWVPFTSESKEAIADYDEIRKEIKLALQECGRRLGVFLRRRERAKSEFRRRNIFELYIEEVVEACDRLKGGKLAKEKLKDQLQKIAAKRTGGARTDEILGKDGSGPEGLPALDHRHARRRRGRGAGAADGERTRRADDEARPRRTRRRRRGGRARRPRCGRRREQGQGRGEVGEEARATPRPGGTGTKRTTTAAKRKKR